MDYTIKVMTFEEMEGFKEAGFTFEYTENSLGELLSQMYGMICVYKDDDTVFGYMEKSRTDETRLYRIVYFYEYPIMKSAGAIGENLEETMGLFLEYYRKLKGGEIEPWPDPFM